MLKRNFANLASLFAVQIANAALPLFVFPYLLRVAGQAAYAQVALAEAVALAVLTLALYSFDIDAVARVVGLDPARHGAAIAQAFSSILLARLLLFAGGAALALIGCLILSPDLVVPLAWWLLLPLSYVLQSAWLFQGLERNVPIATAMISSRLLCVALIVLLVRRPDQYLLIPVLVGSLTLAGALVLLTYAHRTLGVRLRRVPLAEILALFRHGRPVFFGNASVFMYRDMNIVLLTAAGANAPAVAAYSMAEKLLKGLQAGARPLNQFYFPNAVRVLHGKHKPDRTTLLTLLRLTWPQFAALLGLIVVLMAVWLVTADRLPGVKDLPGRGMIGELFALMLPAVFFGVANFMFGSIGLNHLGERRFLFVCLLGVGFANLLSCYVLARFIGASGAALAFVMSEALLAILIVSRYLWRASGIERS